MNDKLFAHPTHRMVLSRVKNQSAPTYLLRFNFESTYSLTKKIFAGRHVPGKWNAMKMVNGSEQRETLNGVFCLFNRCLSC